MLKCQSILYPDVLVLATSAAKISLCEGVQFRCCLGQYPLLVIFQSSCYLFFPFAVDLDSALDYCLVQQ